MAVLVSVLGGCKKQQSPTSAQREAGAAAPSKPAPLLPAPPAPAPAPAVYETDPLYHEAQALSEKDIRKAMGMLEEAIARAPDNPHCAPYYLLLGRLKKEYENYQGYSAGTPEQTEEQKKQFTEYAKGRPTEYVYDEPGADYLYNGFHFKELEKRFPSSLLAADAAYEITNISQGGECEGQLVCFIEGGFAPVREFLLRYPDSAHTAEAAQRADDAFRKTLWGPQWKTDWTEVKDPNQATQFYDPADLKKIVGEYEELAEKVPARFRPRIYETVAYYRARFGETERARQLYNLILQQSPDYENIGDVRKSLKDLH
jgi:tetratricopeptide (TPR) repeat protein